MTLSWSRRAFLRGLGFTSAAMVPTFRRGVLHAQAEPTVPKRFVGFVHFCGTLRSQFFPEMPSPEIALTGDLPPLLTELDAFKSKLLIIKGMRIASAIQAGGSHTRGMVTLMSGHNEDSSGVSGGQTIDHHIGNTIHGGTRFRSLQFAVKNRYGGGISWVGPAQSAPPMQDPVAAFDRIFGQLLVPESELAGIRARRQSIFDHVSAEVNAVSPQLNSVDRERMELFTESVRDVESRLQSTATCEAPTKPAGLDWESDADAPAVGRAMMDLIAASFMCDLTRSVSMQFSRGTSTMTFPHLGIPETHHDCSHLKAEIPDVKSKLTKINIFYAQQFAYLLAKLDAVPQADGKTLLDHAAVWWTSEVGTGGHSLDHIPCVIAGGAGTMRMGRAIEVPLQPHNAVLMAIANAVGAPVSTFGSPEYCTNGPLVLS